MKNLLSQPKPIVFMTDVKLTDFSSGELQTLLNALASQAVVTITYVLWNG